MSHKDVDDELDAALRGDTDGPGTINARMAWVIGLVCALFGFILGHLR